MWLGIWALSRCFATIVIVAGLPSTAVAATLSGVMIYSSDDFGNPSGFDWESEEIVTGMLWRTAVHSHWYSLGLLAGLPPTSFKTPWLNGEDFAVQVALEPGQYDFTVVAESGGGGGGDLQRFVLSIFVDGDLTLPALSVLLPRRDASADPLPQPNRGDIALSFGVEPVRIATAPTYEDGTVRLWVSAAAFEFAEPGSLDLIGPRSLAASGMTDLFGYFTLVVEPIADSEPPAPVDPRAFGLSPLHGGAPPGAVVGPAAALPPSGGAVTAWVPPGAGPLPTSRPVVPVATPAPVGTSTEPTPTVGTPTRNPTRRAKTSPTGSSTTGTPRHTGTPATRTPVATTPTSGASSRD